MSKLKSPLLSLGTRGSVGGAVTFQERQGYTFVREKPTPAYRRTLPQQYQRWLYEDYAYLWTQQSTATRQEYATAGSRFHLTGFQYWMKYYLKNMPDIMAWYPLDSISGALTPDLSRNNNPAIVIGATLETGLIDGAFLFDLINDRLEAPHIAAYTATAELSVECFFRLSSLGTNVHLVTKFRAPPGIMYFLLQITATNIVRLYIGGASGVNAATSLVAVQKDIWYHALGFYDGTNTRLFINALPQNNAPTPVAPTVTTEPLDIANFYGVGRWFPGEIDHIIIRNRAPDTTEIARWAARRYPS